MATTTQRIKNEIDEALDMDSRVDAGRVNVQVKGAKVILSGGVPSSAAARGAAENARHVGGVLGVDNELAVAPTGRDGDEQIARRVLDAFQRNDSLDPRSITVKVNRGTVTLTGTVADYLVRALARGVALCTAGVLFVENRLTVTANSIR